jgi:hypothetical protein
LKENVIMGQIIPAGTGVRRYRDLLVSRKDMQLLTKEDIKEEEPLVEQEEQPEEKPKRTRKKSTKSTK